MASGISATSRLFSLGMSIRFAPDSTVLGPRASREYLAILELAAKESEVKVDEALRGLLEKGEGWVRAEAVREALKAAERKGSIREVEVGSVDRGMFDELWGSGEVLQ